MFRLFVLFYFCSVALSPEWIQNLVYIILHLQKNIIILVDELECGGPSPLGGGLLLTQGVSCAGTPRVLSFK